MTKTSRSTRCAWYSHEYCYWHDPGLGLGYVPVGPDVQPLRQYSVDPDLRRAEGFVRGSGLLDLFIQKTPAPATDEELQFVHPPEYIARIEALSAMGGGEAGIYATINYHTARAARLAAGACAQAITDAFADKAQRSYCFVRPPGHHAERGRAMALCIYNNAAIAAYVALNQGADRVLILDWDVHHGNGIQSIFYDDPRVCYISIHQDGLFPPLSGQIHETGSGPGRGTTINIPLPAGSGHEAYLHSISRVVAPVCRRFAPQVIIVASGLDACAHDPMGRQLCTSQTFYAMTTQLCQLADELCAGRIVFVHEGGYSNWYVPTILQAVAAAIVDQPAPFDPFLHALQHLPGQQLQSHQASRIEQVIALHRDLIE